MSEKKNDTVQRKKDHIDLCLNEDVGFKEITGGFENYRFEHYAITELIPSEIDLSTTFVEKKINYPFLISCMTGGAKEAHNLNSELALVANELNIPIGVGSQRQALEDDLYHDTYKIVRKNAPNVPILGNIGAAQIVQMKDPVGSVQFLVDLVEADLMVIHINPLQEILQKKGEPNFKGLLNRIDILSSKLKVPLFAKEVGAGISKKAAEKLLDVGIKGIDVAGAGGTSWSAVELIRNKETNEYFRDWGIPTAVCLEEIRELFKKYDFTLIASGGIKSGVEIAKSIALGADIAASARPILKSLSTEGVQGVINLLMDWFDTVKKIMYLTGSQNIKELNMSKLQI